MAVKCKPYEIYRIYDVCREACFSKRKKNNVYKWAKYGFAPTKDNPWSRNTEYLVKKKFFGAAVSKEGHPDSLLEHGRSYYY